MDQPQAHEATTSVVPSRPAAALSPQELADIALGKGGDALPLRHLYLHVDGRISRRMFWLHGVGALLVAGVILNALMDIAGFADDIGGKMVNVILAWPYIAVSGKRLHDYNRSAWWMAVNFVPVVGWLLTLAANGCVRGQRGPNRYGPDPQAMRAQRTPGRIDALNSGH